MFEGGVGMGKTIAALGAARERIAAGAACCWVSLSRDDIGLTAFWTRVLTTMVQTDAFETDTLVSRLHAGGLEAMDTDILLEALAERRDPTVLVLDDLDLVCSPTIAVDTAVADSICLMLERLPQWQVYATTAVELPALTGIEARMRFPVQRITGSQLAFTEEETALLLAQRLGPSEDLGELAQRLQAWTGGWPLAIHAFIEELKAGEPTIHASRRGTWIKDYVNRMVETCPPEARPALWASAILEDCPVDVLAAMLDVTEDEVARLLAAIPRLGLSFSFDQRGVRNYRHHEAIRLELLRRSRKELPTEVRRDYYRRATVALTPHHPHEAMRAALRGEAWDELVEVLITTPLYIGLPPVKQRTGEPRLRDLPSGVRRDYPVLDAFALIHEYEAPLGRAAQVLQGLRMLAGPKLADASQKPGLVGAIASTLRMVVARLSGNEELALRMADRSGEALLELREHELQRVSLNLPTVLAQRAITYIHAERFDRAEDALAQLPSMPSSELKVHIAHERALSAWVAAGRGEMREAGRLVDIAARTTDPIGWQSLYIGVGYRIAAALCRLEAGDHEAADAHLVPLNHFWTPIEHWPHLVVLKAHVIWRRVGTKAALEYLESEFAARRSRIRPTAALRAHLDALHTRLIWHSGRNVRKLKRQYSTGLPAVYEALSRNEQDRARALVTLELAQDTLIRRPRTHAELLLLQAHMARLDGAHETAGAAARHACSLLAEHELSLPYRALTSADIVELQRYEPRLRPEHGAPDRAVPSPQLSEKERRTLAAIAKHGSTQAAAEALTLSRHTLRNQKASAFVKLGSHNLDEALKIAREAGLLREYE